MAQSGGLVAIFAHPDDETFGVGGTMARYAEDGVPVTMVCATRGEVGEISPGTGATPETLGRFREQELRDAMALLGVADVRFLDFRDSGMAGTPENADARNLINAAPDSVIEPLVRTIRERQPEVIATWDESGGYGHPDHVAVHHHATAAFHAAADASRFADAGAPWSTPLLYYVSIPIEEFQRLMAEMRELGVGEPEVAQEESIDTLPRVPTNCIIDVSAYYERKMEAMLSHKTQIRDMDPFMAIPEEIRRRFFGREFFYRAHPQLPDGVTIDDFLSDP